MEVNYADASNRSNVGIGEQNSKAIGDSDNNNVNKEYDDVICMSDEVYEEDDSGNFRPGRGRGNFGFMHRGRGRGPPPPGWMNGPPPPMRFRGRGYGPGGPPMRGGPPPRGFFRPRGAGPPGPRGFGPSGGPNFENNWGPMGPPPPMMPPPFGPPPGMMGPGGPMGPPPPNMMGQPPPFGAPPNMPNMPPQSMSTPELWVETKSEEGKSYYYHSRTRETTWSRPVESPMCRVITQGEMEAMAASGKCQFPTMGPQNMGSHNMGMGAPTGGPMGPSIGMNHNGPMGPMMPTPGSMPPPFMGQPPPWAKEGMNDKMMEETMVMDEDRRPMERNQMMMQNTHANGNMMGYGSGQMGPGPIGPSGSMGPPGPMCPPPGPQGPMGPGTGGFPGNWGGGWGGWQPPIAQPPPGMPAMGNVGMPQPPPGAQAPRGAQPPVVPESANEASYRGNDKKETVIPDELAAAAREWVTYNTQEGRTYYHHLPRGESVWEKPAVLKQFEDLQTKIAIEKGEKKIIHIDLDEPVEVIDVDAHAEATDRAAATAAAATAAAAQRAKEEAEKQEKERIEKERQEKERLEKEKKEKEKAAENKCKPVSSTPIAGTPWCVVWTGQGRVFFYNPTAGQSVWERPPELAGRADVDRAVSRPPHALPIQDKSAEVGSGGTPTGAANGELKRANDSDSDDSENEPIKKLKTELTNKRAAVANATAGSSVTSDLEEKAARERASMPHEERLRLYRELLVEKGISAFVPREKQLFKIVFDYRYKLLSSKERVQVFDQFTREMAEVERKQKKNRVQQLKTAFRTLMEEAKVHAKTSYSEFSSKHAKDTRFKAVEKPRDREAYFAEYIVDVKRADKEERERRKEQAKTDFIAMLKEKQVDRHLRWADIKKKIEGETRYKAVEGSTMREDLFREYCRMMKEEKKKLSEIKEREKSLKKEKKEKEKESRKEKKKEKAADQEEEATPEASTSDAPADEEAARREREARAQASIKEREREVQRALATSLRDRDKEREFHKRDEAVQHFNALLADLVRNPDLTWRDAKKQLKKDHRYDLAKLLPKEDKERLFTVHIGALEARRREKLRAVLADLLAPAAPAAPAAPGQEVQSEQEAQPALPRWRDVLPRLKEDPRTPHYASVEKMEREFRDYERDRHAAAKNALRELLQETRTLTHRTRANSAGDARRAHDALRHDARYHALAAWPEERDAIINAYLEELERRGPPPPPTATEPVRRKI